MDITEYISFVYQGEASDSAFQYVTEKPKEYYAQNHQALKAEIATFYKSRALPVLEIIKPSIIYPFLDYHLQAYKGDPLDFFYMVKDIRGILSNAGFEYDFLSIWLENDLLKQVLQEWVQEKKAEIKVRQVLAKETDLRIRVNTPKESIQKHFMEAFVNTKDKKGIPYFSEEEVMSFLHANFTDFNPKAEISMLKSAAFKPQAHIRRTVRAFYTKYTTGSREKRRYCELIRDNFLDFENCDFEETIVKGFSK